jgi:Protein of unknown function (DUF2809)
MKFSKGYFILAVLLFVIEVLIALFVRDRFIRPYGGDVLVVMLVYCAVRSFFVLRPLPLAIGVLIFSFTVEFLQYLNIVDILGLRNSEVASTVIGTLFEWGDLLAYVVGIVIILIFEYYRQKRPVT